jgi:hypothetical protein
MHIPSLLRDPKLDFSQLGDQRFGVGAQSLSDG